MDIVNWSALQSNLLVRDSISNPNDLVLVGSNATWNKRGDKYLTYAVPVSALGGGGSGSVGVIFKSTVPGTDVIGVSTKLLTTYVLLIPANTFAPGDIIRIHYRGTKKAPTGDTAMVLAIGPTTDTNDATALGGFNLTIPSVFGQMKRDLIIPSDPTKFTNFISNKFDGPSDDDQTNQKLQELNIDWAKPQYLFFGAENSDVSDSFTGTSYYIEKL